MKKRSRSVFSIAVAAIILLTGSGWLTESRAATGQNSSTRTWKSIEEIIQDRGAHSSPQRLSAVQSSDDDRNLLRELLDQGERETRAIAISRAFMPQARDLSPVNVRP